LQDEYKRLQQKDKTRLNLNEKDLFRLLKKYMVGNDKVCAVGLELAESISLQSIRMQMIILISFFPRPTSRRPKS
jgi:hypothetical protein